MRDELGANWKGIENVFGNEALERVASCKPHFLKSRNNFRSKLPSEEDKARFTNLTDAIVESNTVSKIYIIIIIKLLGGMNEELTFLELSAKVIRHRLTWPK